MKTESIWNQPLNLNYKSKNETHIWRLPLEISSSSLEKAALFLSEDELSRANRFYFDKHRSHFIAARGQVRNILGRYLQIKNKDLFIFTNEFGKPYLKNSPLYFNISHSHNLALLAINLNYDLGVDIEWKKRKVNFIDISKRFFSLKEFSDLESLPQELQRQGFFNCWTRKEAYIKARGQGLKIPLAEFVVSLKPDDKAELRSTNHDQNAVKNWYMYSVDPHPDYTGALCVNHAQNQIKYWDGTNIF